MGINGPDEHEDGWFDDENDSNDPRLIAGELDHSIPREERGAMISAIRKILPEDYTD